MPLAHHGFAYLGFCRKYTAREVSLAKQYNLPSSGYTQLNEQSATMRAPAASPNGSRSSNSDDFSSVGYQERRGFPTARWELSDAVSFVADGDEAFSFATARPLISSTDSARP